MNIFHASIINFRKCYLMIKNSTNILIMGLTVTEKKRKKRWKREDALKLFYLRE